MTDDCCYSRRQADVPVAPALLIVYFVPMVLHRVHLDTPLPSSMHFRQLLGHAATRKTRYSDSYQLSEIENNNTETASRTVWQQEPSILAQLGSPSEATICQH